MTNWDNRLAEHPFWETASELQRTLEDIDESGIDAEAAEDLARLRELVRRAGSIARSVDPFVAATAPFNTAQASLQKAQQETANYISNDNGQHLKNANTHAENALPQLMGLPRVETPRDLDELQEAAVSFRRAMAQHVRYAQDEIGHLEEKLTSLESRVGELTSDIAQQKARLDNAITSFQEQFSVAEGERGKQFQEALSRVQGQLAQSEEKFQEAQGNRKDQFAGLLADTREESEALFEEFRNAGEAQRDEATGQADLLLESLRNHLAEAEKVVGAVAQTGMAGGFQKVADRAKKQMWLWQVITVAAMIGFIVVVAMFLPETGPSFSWPSTIKRILISLAFGALAAYGAREAGRQAEQERRNRQLELEIASIGPFMAALDKEKQDLIRERMTDRMFGHDGSAITLEGGPVTANGLVDLLRLVLTELLKKSK